MRVPASPSSCGGETFAGTAAISRESDGPSGNGPAIFQVNFGDQFYDATRAESCRLILIVNDLDQAELALLGRVANGWPTWPNNGENHEPDPRVRSL